MTTKPATLAMAFVTLTVAVQSGCEDSAPTSAPDAGSTSLLLDGSSPASSPSDAGPNDAGPNDAGPNDAGPNDAGTCGATASGASMLVLCGSNVMRLYTDPCGADELVAHLQLSTDNGVVAFPDKADSFAAISTRYFANAGGTLYMGTPGSTDVVMSPLLKGGQSYGAMDVEAVAGEMINLVVAGSQTSIKRLVVNAAIPDVSPGGTVVQWSQGTSPDCVIGGGSSSEPGDMVFTQGSGVVIGGRCVAAAPPAGRPVAFKISAAGTDMVILSAPGNQRNTQVIGRDSTQRLILIDDQGNLHDGSSNPATLLRASTCHNPRGSG